MALKLVHPHLLEDDAINKLFLDEARTAAHVAHPNVVSVEEIGQTNGSYFIAMEYVHGVSLSELLASLAGRRLRMSPKLCVWLVAQMAEALHAVHEATNESGAPLNIVHRDVSPQNVLIGHTGHVKLIDFGIAKSQPTAQNASGRRAVLGKLGYMAPEQLRLESADRRSDVYALGVMLWEMLTARSLFRCKRVDDERDWATREAPPPPSKYSATPIPALDRVVLKALAYEPSDRYETAFELRTALLRAFPSAVKVDAPMVAQLMRTMLGHELERRRASLPSEVSLQLDIPVEATTSPAICVDELTADLGDVSEVSEGGIRRTLASSPSALRRDPAPDALKRVAIVGVPPLPSSELAAREHEPTFIISSPEAAIPTIEAPALTHIERTSAVSLTARRWMVRAAFIGAVCLAFGIFVGAQVSGAALEPLPSTTVVRAVVTRTRDASAARRRAHDEVELTNRAVEVADSVDAGDPARLARTFEALRREPAEDERPRARKASSSSVSSASKRALSSRHGSHGSRSTRAKNRRRPRAE